jgi:2-dehydro-3-deoxygalactonokinase
MIGSTIGWKQTPYLRCPVNILDIVDGRISFTARGIEFSILSGLKTTNLLGLPDLMRGEELQLLGWNVLHADFHGKRLFALPGTHNKWGLVQSRKVETFLSAFTGELFGLLKQHSILIAADPAKTSNDFHEVTFLQGVECAQNLGKANLLHTLFSVRSRQVLKELDTEQSVSYLSGMIIGADIKGAYQTFEGHVTEPLEVTVIGESGLSSRYLTAFKYLKIKADHALPTDVAIAGYTAIYEKIYE